MKCVDGHCEARRLVGPIAHARPVRNTLSRSVRQRTDECAFQCSNTSCSQCSARCERLTGVLNVYWRRHAFVDNSFAGVCPVNISQSQRDEPTRKIVKVPTRIQGGNWQMQGLRRSGFAHDEGECQMSIAKFVAEHRPRDADDA